jgi:hypothetical protein
MTDSRFEYIGNSNELFDHNGLNISSENPFDTIELLEDALAWATPFLKEHFINNVDPILSDDILNNSTARFLHDVNNHIWIMTCNGVHYVFI